MQIRIRDQESFWRGIRDWKIGIRDKYPGAAILVWIRSICIQQDAEIWGTWIKQKWKCIYSFSTVSDESASVTISDLMHCQCLFKTYTLKRPQIYHSRLCHFFILSFSEHCFCCWQGRTPWTPGTGSPTPRAGRRATSMCCWRSASKRSRYGTVPKVPLFCLFHEILLRGANKTPYGTFCE